MAVPIAKALGLCVIVSENARAKDALLSGVNYIIDTLGDKGFDLSQINDALQLVAGGHINGKVILRFL